jgi:hypothetical protein
MITAERSAPAAKRKRPTISPVVISTGRYCGLNVHSIIEKPARKYLRACINRKKTATPNRRANEFCPILRAE